MFKKHAPFLNWIPDRTLLSTKRSRNYYKVIDEDTIYFIVFKIPKDLTRRAKGPIRIKKNRFLRKMRLPKTFNWQEV